MASSWVPWLRSIYLSATRGTSASVEWAWIIGRLAVVTILVPAIYTTFDGFSGFGAIPSIVGFVLAYSAFLVFLLRRNLVRPAFLIGFLLDNITLVMV
jgi:hypothetical protein